VIDLEELEFVAAEVGLVDETVEDWVEAVVAVEATVVEGGVEASEAEDDISLVVDEVL